MNTHMLSRTLQLLFILALLTPAHAQIVAYMAIVKKDGSANAMQFVDACVTNIKQSNRKALNPIVAAIRYSENGKAGKEFGAKNDPTNLNKNWVRNVTYFYSKFYSITPSK